MTDSKATRLRALMRAGKWRKALALANSFGRLGAHEKAIRDGHMAASHPSFCLAVKKDPDLLVQQGIDALLDRYLPAGKDHG